MNLQNTPIETFLTCMTVLNHYCLVADDEYLLSTAHDDPTINEVQHDEHDDQDHDSIAYANYGDGEGGDGGDGGEDFDHIDLELTGDLQKDFDALTSSLAEHLKRTGNKNFDDVDIRELLETKGELPPVIKSLTPPTTTVSTAAPTKLAKSGGGGIKFDRFLNFGNSASGRAGGAHSALTTTATRKNVSWHDRSDEDREEASDPSKSVTLCKLMNICDAPKKGKQNKNKRPKAYFSDTIAMGSETHRSVVDPPLDLLWPLRKKLTRKRRKRKKLNLRTGEKTAVEVAQLLSGGGLETAASTRGQVGFSSKVSEGALRIPTSDRTSPSSKLQVASLAGKRGDMEVAEGKVKKTLVESEEEDVLQIIDGTASAAKEDEFAVGEHNIDRDDSSWTPVLFQSPLLDTSTSSSSQSLSGSEDGWKPIGEPVTKQRD